MIISPFSLFILCTFSFFFVSLYLLLRKEFFFLSRLSFFFILVLFSLETWLLLDRGRIYQSCPLYTYSDFLLFLSLSTSFFYLLLGKKYRFSLIGVLTLPVLFLLHFCIFFLGNEIPAISSPKIDLSLEYHKAFSLFSYGAFLLSAISSFLLLSFEKILHSKDRSFLPRVNSPSICFLSQSIFRLLLAGTLLSGMSILFILFSIYPFPLIKGSISLIAWFSYFSLLLIYILRGIPPHALAISSLLIFFLQMSVLFLLRI